MINYHLAADNSEIEGRDFLFRVKDFLFDDESWIVHYLVAESATQLKARKVLIPPFLAGRPDWERKRLFVALTPEQIRSSPPIEADMPIAQQYESGLKLPGSHLRSMLELIGYRVYSIDGEVGIIEDFIVEDTLWGVHGVAMSLSKPTRLALVPPGSIRSISAGIQSPWS